MKKHLIPGILLLIAVMSLTAYSQPKTEISAEKKAAIAELITVMKADVQTKEIMQTMMSQMDSMYPSLIDSLVEQREDLNAAQKQQVKNELIEKNRQFNQKFNERFLKAINFQDYMKAVFYPLYDKFFTTEEIRDLLAFYKTASGQKFISVMPQLSGESMKMAQEYLVPLIDKLMQEILDEELNNIETKKNPPPPAPKGKEK